MSGGAIYNIETVVTVSTGDPGGSYTVGTSDNGAGGPLPFVPSSGFVRKIGITRRDPAAGLPGGGTFSFMAVACLCTAGGQAEIDRGVFTIVNQMSIVPGAGAAPAYGATGMIYSDPAVAVVRSPDIILNNGGGGYPYAVGRTTVAGDGRICLMIQLEANAVQDEQFLIQLAIQGFDTLQGDPASFYRNADPGSF